VKERSDAVKETGSRDHLLFLFFSPSLLLSFSPSLLLFFTSFSSSPLSLLLFFTSSLLHFLPPGSDRAYTVSPSTTA